MTAVWPASLPQRPLGEGFAEQPANLVVRTPMDVGPAKVRRRATAGVGRLQMAFRLSASQLATFRTFLHADLQDRALPFSWVHPVTGVAGWFRIVEQPIWEPISGGLAWKLTLVLELLP